MQTLGYDLHDPNCNIPSFQKSEKSEKFKTFSNYMYFTLKRNFMHCMHHHLASFAFDCSKDWNIIFQFKIYLIKLYVWVLYYTQLNILMFAKFDFLHCVNCLNCLICLKLLVGFWFVFVCSNYLLVASILNKPQKYLI